MGRAIIKVGKAYVCDLSADEIRQFRGTLTEPGRKARIAIVPSKRIDLFERMKNGDFLTLAHTARED